MESLNLASVWNLPVIFICKDDGWAITAKPGESTGSDMGARVRGLGVRYMVVDGLDIEQVWQAAHQAIERARLGKGPTFIHAACVHIEGHFLGLVLLRLVRDPLRELPGIAGPLIRSFVQPGGGTLGERLAGAKLILSTILATLRDPRRYSSNDPIVRLRSTLISDPVRLKELDDSIEAEISAAMAAALHEVAS